MRAVPATRDNVAVERRAIVFIYDEVPQLPRSDISARKEEWRAGVITSVDTKAQTFQMTGYKGSIPFAFSRIVVSMQESVPERPQHFPVPFKDPT